MASSNIDESKLNLPDAELRPEIIHIPYGSEKHRRIVTAIKQRERMSKNEYSQVRRCYSDSEEAYRAYVKPTKNDAEREALRRAGKPQYTTIYVPYTLAILWAAHTYWTSVFLGRNPVWQIIARHAEPHQHVQAVEAMLDYQVYTGGHMVPYYLWLMDAGKYGRGILGSYWAEEYSNVSRIETVEPSLLGKTILGAKPKRRRVTEQVPAYQGMRVYNVRPQDWRPDPRVPSHRFQDGEFCGRFVEVGWNTVIKRHSLGVYFNVKELAGRLKGARSSERDLGSGELILPYGMDTLYTESGGRGSRGRGFIELLEMTIEIIPSEWELGKSNQPEKYVFTLANDDVLLSVHPLGELHDKFPFSQLEYELEAYSLNKRSMFEIGKPLNDTISWLFNSHMYNVRKVMNDTLFVDPSRYVMKDLQATEQGGKLIRVKPEYYGEDVKSGVHQLQVVDVTREHMKDAEIAANMLMRLLGVNDAIMGMLAEGGRKTATEVRASSSFGVNRQKTICEWYSSQGFQPLADMMIASTQQHYDGEQQFRMAGDLMGQQGALQVTPEMIAGQYNFVPVDGTLPVDKFALANLWKELYMGMREDPVLMQKYDMASIFGWIAQLGGIRNLAQFEIQSPDDLARQVAAGNIVPIGGEGGGPRTGGGGAGPAGGGNSRSENRDLTQVPRASAAAGVGRTG